MTSSKVYSYDQARVRIERYCAYRDRCQFEVEEKLRSFGLSSPDIDKLSTQLIETGFLDEKRFVIAFVTGKFRLKRWGRHKITQNLKEKRISNELIDAGLNEIDEEEYYETLQKLIRSKWEDNMAGVYASKSRIARYTFAKGFETELIWKAIDLCEEESQRSKDNNTC